MNELRSFLDQPLSLLSGVGARRQSALVALGLRTFGDLLHHFPRTHVDLRGAETLASLRAGTTKTVWGTVRSVRYRHGRRGQWIAELELADGVLSLVWFTHQRRPPPVDEGWQGLASGDVRRYGGLCMVHPRVEKSAQADATSLEHGRLLPVYPIGQGITPRLLRSWVDQVLGRLEEVKGAAIQLPDAMGAILGDGGDQLLQAYRALHLPRDRADLLRGHQLLSRVELLFFAYRQLQARSARRRLRAPAIRADAAVARRIDERLGFELTPGQRKVVQEVATDLAQQVPMRRLVQGEVGCGKTAVAMHAALSTIAAGFQVALLAPTAALALQHQERWEQLLSGSRVRTARLDGALTAGERRRVADEIASGDLDLVVGTHALLGEVEAFPRLALVIIDEEQRFGVEQRQKLLQPRGAEAPHALSMSATPIPRSLALAIYADTDLSTVDGLPPGRGQVTTHRVSQDRWSSAQEFLVSELDRGHRVLFVVPRIDAESPEAGTDQDFDDEELETRAKPPSVESLLERVTGGPLGPFEPQALHGRLKNREQERLLRGFRDGTIPVLVATTLVEVGLDVPELTVLWVEGADHFGLAQLHQLRGRVGRSGRRSWCFVSAADPGEEAAQRLETFCTVDDGFELAERDLATRGAGERFGVQQSGLPWFRLSHPLLEREAFAGIRAGLEQLSGTSGSRALHPLLQAIQPHFCAPEPG